MSKKIVIESKNGADNIDKSRQVSNISNLHEDIKEWQRVVEGDQTNSVVPTLLSRLEKNSMHYGFARKDDINFESAQTLAKKYLEADPWLQISFCRDSTRQSVDEMVQIETLRKYVNDSFKGIPNGKEVPFNGKLVSKKEAVGLNGKMVKARSVDAVGQVVGRDVKVFQKYSKVSGSGQSHQTIETQNWLEEVRKIPDKTILFVAQLDGNEAESHIPELRKLVAGEPNIFVGNSEQIIDWLNTF